MDFRSWIVMGVYILSITKAVSITIGCDDQLTRNECAYNITCTESMDLNQFGNLQSYNNYHCSDYIYYNGAKQLPVYITYRRLNNNQYDYHIIWNDFNNYIINRIVGLDLSHNLFEIHPKLQSMPNLKFLNISHNRLTVAKLSNNNEFTHLSEVDFSYNAITLIEVDRAEYAYDTIIKLDLSHNVIENIPEAIFDSFSQLEYLNFSNNHLTVLNILYFEGIKNLKSLQLDYNDIIDINSSLLRFKELRELSVKHNKIEKILRRDFQNLVKLSKLDLSSNNILNIEKHTFDNMTFLTTLDLSENALDIIDKEAFTFTSHLNSVNLYKNKIKQLPKELFKNKNISFFSIQDNNLEGELLSGMFLGLSNIFILDISNQYLTSIENYAFMGLGKLEILLLNNNKIKNVSKRSLTFLQNLEVLDLSNNDIVSIDFEKNELVNLKSLSFQNNLISTIHQKDLNYLIHLQFLDLSNNNISKIENNSFKEIRKLENFGISKNPLISILDSSVLDGLILLPSLDISFSNVTLIKNNTFGGMSQLKYLSMSHSSIEDVEFNSFVDTGHIKTIDLSYNKLTNFTVNATDLQSISTLLLNNNLLTEISLGLLKNFPNLSNISFAYNNLHTIHFEAFAGQKSLLHLDLSFNPDLTLKLKFYTALNSLHSLNLSGIKNVSFSQMNDTLLTELELPHARIQNVTALCLNSLKLLEYLVLNNNEITNIDKADFIVISHLQHLDLSYNRINYIQPGAFKNNYDLKILNISHNFLESINYGTFRGLINLNILDLSFNKIQSLENEKVSEAQNLRVLIADNNRISDIEDLKLLNTQLSKLSIGDNPIPCKRIFELKQYMSFEITALKHEEHNDNIEGITCNNRYPLIQEKQYIQGNNESQKILTVLRSILMNSSTSRVFQEHSELDGLWFFSNISDQIKKSNSDVVTQLSLLNDAAFLIKNENNRTNSLLERLLKVMTSISLTYRSTSKPLAKENLASDNLNSHLNKIKQDLENDIVFQKETILADVDSKISSVLARINPVQEKFAASKNTPTQNKTVFTEICVALILTILISLLILISYKWYYRGCTSWRSTSVSSRQITESLENSNL